MTREPPRPTRQHLTRRRGSASVMAMMFLVIFGSLAAAMAIVAQGNLATADAHLKINRSLAAAETAMNYLVYRINQATNTVLTTDGLIDGSNAPALWDQTRAALLASLQNEFHNIEEPYENGTTLHIGPIAVGPNEPLFTATMRPHPLPGENYNSTYYQRPPYSDMNPPVSSVSPLNSTWIRIRVEAADGDGDRTVTRSIQLDFKLDKKIRFALLSRSRIMIGQNVLINGPIGSRFMETHLANGHPVQMMSDFRGLDPDLDAELDALLDSLAAGDMNGDNRLDLNNDTEAAALTSPNLGDYNGDGFVDEYDMFLWKYDTNGDGIVTAIELGADTDIRMAQLLELIDTFGDPSRAGYNDGYIDNNDRYAKLKGEIKITAALSDWEAGAAAGRYQDFLQGPIKADHNEAALTFQAADTTVHSFEASDFDVSSFYALATGDLATQAAAQAASHDPADPNSPQPLGPTAFEEVPFGSPYPYDYYERPIYQNMTFTNVRIPQGTNALFKNCKFVGVTFVETESDNDDPAFNYAGAQESDGSPKHPDEIAIVNGTPVPDTKTVSNNIRFDDCIFEGMVVSGTSAGAQPQQFTQARNKVAFTGDTKFDIEGSTTLTAAEKTLFRRSTILMPHYSVEMGTFVDPTDAGEKVSLSGTIVTGLIDIRGQVKIVGTLLTTFEPTSGSGPVIGDTSPDFNTTLGYFPSAAGDLEAELPATGLGVIHVTYDPTIPLPDGILGPIEIRPVMSTYFEGGS